MKKIIPVIAIVFAFTLGTVFSADIATAAKPVTEVFVTNTEPIEVTGSLSADPVCPAENVQHWLNIQATPLEQIQHSSEPTIVQEVFYLPVLTMGSELVTLDSANEKVADRLNELGYFVNDPTPRPVEENDIDTFVGFGFLITVGYSTICAEN